MLCFSLTAGGNAKPFIARSRPKQREIEWGREKQQERERDQAKENKRNGGETTAIEGMVTMVGVTATVMLLAV